MSDDDLCYAQTVMAELEQLEWHEKNRRLLNEFNRLEPVIKGNKTFDQYLKENEDGRKS